MFWLLSVFGLDVARLIIQDQAHVVLWYNPSQYIKNRPAAMARTFEGEVSIVFSLALNVHMTVLMLFFHQFDFITALYKYFIILDLRCLSTG